MSKRGLSQVIMDTQRRMGKLLGVGVKAGDFLVNEIAYDKKGKSTVTLLKKCKSIAEAVDFLDSL